MEPQLPSPAQQPERGPAHFSGGETIPVGNASERSLQQGERHETREQHVGGAGGDPASVQQAPILPPLPTVAPIAQQGLPGVVKNSSNPAAAADEDLIEKEWVEKAKKVIADTKHDPHLQEKEVSKLQADYLKKRYDKTVNLPAEGA